MDIIQETPTKRRKLDAGDVSQNKSYDSDNDSGDSLLGDYDAFTTLPPLHKSTLQDSYVTQPTQIVNTSTPKIKSGKCCPGCWLITCAAFNFKESYTNQQIWRGYSCERDGSTRYDVPATARGLESSCGTHNGQERSGRP